MIARPDEPRVLVVLSLWKRPDNTLRQETAMMHHGTAIVDSSPVQYGSWNVPDHGPPTRFAPAFMHHDYDAYLFLDDDFLPTEGAVANCVRVAQSLDWKFSTIGQVGRRYAPADDGGLRYVKRNIRLRSNPVPVDLTCRAHFVRADLMRHVLNFKWDLLDLVRAAGSEDDRALFGRSCRTDDDLLLCHGIARATGWPSYLIPSGPAESMIIASELPDGGGGVSSQSDHVPRRNRMIQAARDVGWESR